MNCLYLGSIEGRIIQYAMIKTYGQSILVTGFKKDTDQFTTFEPDIPENNMMAFDQTQITVHKFAVNENRIRDIDTIKITMDETAVFIFSCFEYLDLKIDIFELFIFD